MVRHVTNKLPAWVKAVVDPVTNAGVTVYYGILKAPVVDLETRNIIGRSSHAAGNGAHLNSRDYLHFLIRKDNPYSKILR